MATTRSIDLTDEPVANDYVEVPAAAPTSTEEPVPEISDERREEINNEMTKVKWIKQVANYFSLKEKKA